MQLTTSLAVSLWRRPLSSLQPQQLLLMPSAPSLTYSSNFVKVSSMNASLKCSRFHKCVLMYVAVFGYISVRKESPPSKKAFHYLYIESSYPEISTAQTPFSGRINPVSPFAAVLLIGIILLVGTFEPSCNPPTFRPPVDRARQVSFLQLMSRATETHTVRRRAARKPRKIFSTRSRALMKGKESRQPVRRLMKHAISNFWLRWTPVKKLEGSWIEA
ncbi:hypothetical protein K458DRAFT_410867 [Lentithecium fluviatile CBS 122367]|uniref:Uncharacterized protein n=1 Tax=Lentithecium fluviatile CBS 122367 TaxID=1168545 RepID=A0A6G1ICD3_9PLEO|nr:hypothetical protein K458DRAFT_410867 [Lentithecium fluviatile CBS 122367]